MSEELTKIAGSTEQDVWQNVEADMKQYPGLFDYSVLIEQNGKPITLVIDIDPGGGFEGGYAYTTFTAPLQTSSDFKFAIHKEGFLDELGKFLGLQDIETGYPEFDKKVIVKTNHEQKIKDIFRDAAVRQIFKDLNDYKFSITHHHNSTTKLDEKFLELVIEDGINDPSDLRRIYHAYYEVLIALEAV